MLRRVAAEKLILISSGGSDWLPGSGKLEKVDGGFRFTARKIFSSGVPAGDILMTTGVYNDPNDGPTVYHFPLPLKSDGVKILDTWRTIGMRGTGSHDVEIKDVFLPDAVMQGVRRPAGKWHPFMHAVVLAAFPIFYGAYLGVAEAAREIALSIAARKKEDPLLPLLVGEMENQIVSAQIAHASMVALTATQKPGAEATNAMACRRTIFVNAVTRAAEKAMEAGGAPVFTAQPVSNAAFATSRGRATILFKKRRRPASPGACFLGSIRTDNARICKREAEDERKPERWMKELFTSMVPSCRKARRKFPCSTAASMLVTAFTT